MAMDSVMLRSAGFDPATGIYSSPLDSVHIPPAGNIASLVLSADVAPASLALIDCATAAALTHADLRRTVRCLAAGLAAAGLRPKDVLFILAPNSILLPPLALAAMLLGAIASLANPLQTPREIAAQLRSCRPNLLCTTTPFLPKLAGIPLPFILLDDDHAPAPAPPCSITRLSTLLQADPSRVPAFSARSQDTAALLYSSGTTGTSKGVAITHGNLIAMVSLLRAMEGDDPLLQARVFLCLLPMFHVYGLMLFLCYLPAVGCASVVMPKFDMVEMLEAIQQFKVTNLPLVPPVVLALTRSSILDKYDLSSVRQVGCGAAPLSKELVAAFGKRFPHASFQQGYGLTESTGIATVSSTDDFKHHNSGGRLIPNTEAKIVDPDSGRALPPNQTGELWLRGPTIMPGYFDNTEATKATIDPEGWLHTGDLCYFDEDGYLYIVDRLKELIKYKAFQVAPAELESVLLSHPEILDAAVIPFPDEEAGQIPMAYVVRDPKSTINGDDVISFVSKQVAPYKKVRRVAFVNAIPKSASGKILRQELIKKINSRI